MENKESYQLEIKGAIFYEKNFVPALFEPWAKVTVEKLSLNRSDHFLDIACGTGIVARIAKENTDNNLKITGCDINEGMLKVAEALDPEINWVQGFAEDLPFDDDSFEKISCQFGFMFFQDQVKALSEMDRVKKKSGKIIIGIWDKIEENEGYYDLWQMVENFGGKDLGLILRSPFNLGDITEINRIFKLSNISNYTIETTKNQVEFPSIEHWIDCDVKASPIAENISDQQYLELKKEAQKRLRKYVDDDQIVRFRMSAHLVTIE